MNLNIKVSRFLVSIILFTYLGAGAVVASTAMPWAMRLGVLLALSVGLWRAWRCYAWPRSDQFVRAIQLSPAGDALMRCGRHGDWRPLQILPYLTHAWLVVILMQVPGRATRAYLLPWDCMEAEQFRRLRVWMLNTAEAAA